jgi:hypothetical protein
LGNRFSKPVAFNHTNEQDKKILRHVEGRNFSGYVKKLILVDIEREKAMKMGNDRVIQIKGSGIKYVEER